MWNNMFYYYRGDKASRLNLELIINLEGLTHEPRVENLILQIKFLSALQIDCHFFKCQQGGHEKQNH